MAYKKIIDQIPSKDDWGDFSDLDEVGRMDANYAFKQFFGKSNLDMQSEFKRNVIMRVEDLQWMPFKPFQYYIFGFKEFIEKGDYNQFDEQDNIGSLYIELLKYRAKHNPDQLKLIYSELRPLLRKLANEQDYENKEIFGDFSEQVNEIENLLS